jgi:hypothetical protein
LFATVVASWLLSDDVAGVGGALYLLGVCAIAGALAGLRTAWAAVPAGLWLSVWLHSARPTDCHSGCEYAGPPAGIILAASLGIALLATLGAAAVTPGEPKLQHLRWLVLPLALVLGATTLLVAIGSLRA